MVRLLKWIVQKKADLTILITINLLKSFDDFLLYIKDSAGGAYMSRIEACPRNTNGKKRDSLMQNAYLNLPDLHFFYWCNEQFSVNRGVYNTIDRWFYENGIIEVIFRRMYILSFLKFVSEAGLKAEEQKFIRFGNGGLINQLTKFIKSIEAKS